MNVALGGGGDAHQSRAIDEVFASWLPHQGRLLYIPNALGSDPVRISAATRWIRATFASIAVLEIETRTDLVNLRAGDLIGFDGIYIGGGNTYSLLHEFRAAGFLPVLRHAIHEGVCVYGGSAGAVVLGADISTVRQIDSNDVGLVDTKAVDVAGGLAVSVHYTRDHDQPISTYVAETGLSVVAIPEDAGVVLVDDYIGATGNSPVMLFTPGATPTKLAPADTSRDSG